MLELLALLGYYLAARNTYVWAAGPDVQPEHEALYVVVAALWPFVWITVAMMVGWDWLRLRMK